MSTAKEELEDRETSLTIGQKFELMRDAAGEAFTRMREMQKVYGPAHRIARAAGMEYIQATEAVAVFRQEHIGELTGLAKKN